MAGTVVADTFKSSTTSPPAFQNTSGTQIGTLCRAWVNFVGSTGSIAASFNVSSITRNGTGNYTVNFTNAFADTNYASVATVGNSSATGSATQTRFNWDGTSIVAPTTTAQRLVCGNFGSDPEYVYCAVFR